MPQVVKGTKKRGLGLLGNLLVGKDVPEEGYPDMEILGVDFDPKVSSPTTGLSIYTPIFNEFELAYKNITGLDLDLGQGSNYIEGVNRETNKSAAHDLEMYKQDALKIANENPNFRNHLSDNMKIKFAEEWGNRIYGLVNYMAQHLPDKGTKEGDEMRSSFNTILDDAYGNYLVPFMQHHAESTAVRHSVDSPGDWTGRIGAMKDVMFGTSKQASPELWGRFRQLVEEGGKSAKGIASPYRPNEISKTVEDYAQDEFESGMLQEEKGKKRLRDIQETDPATGRFAESFSERDIENFRILGMDAPEPIDRISLIVRDPIYSGIRASESLGSQALTTGLGVAGGAAIQFIPHLRGASLLVRTIAGMVGSSPAMLAGYALESGDAYSAARDHLKELKYRATAEKDRLDPSEFDTKYGIWVGENHRITADQLEDDDITKIAQELGQVYAKFATGVEVVATSLQSGIAARQVATSLGKVLGKSEGQSKLAKFLSEKLGSTIMKIGGASKYLAGGVGVEATEEGFQAYIQEELLSHNLPQYTKDIGKIYDEMISGGVFGGAMRAGGSVIGGITKRMRESADVASAEVERIETIQTRERARTDDTDDVGIKAISLLYGDFRSWVDTNENLNSGEKESLLARFEVISDDIIKTAKNPNAITKFFIDNKEEIEVMGEEAITEEDLAFSGALNEKQIAAILGIDIADLKMPEVLAKKTKKKKAPLPDTDPDLPDLSRLEQESGAYDAAQNLAQDYGYDPGDPVDVASYLQEENLFIDKELTEAEAQLAFLLNTPLSEQNITKTELETRVAQVNERISILRGNKKAVVKTKVPNLSKKKKKVVAPPKTKAKALEGLSGLQKEMTEQIPKVANKRAKHWVPKEQVKTRVATQFIGQGSSGSSTDNYKKMYEKAGVANTGEYSSDDIIFIASNGRRPGGFKPVVNGVLKGEYTNILKAMAEGATIIMDTKEHLKKHGDYNTGEMALAKFLHKHGYVYSDGGFWKPGSKVNYGEILLSGAKILEATVEEQGKAIAKLDSRTNQAIIAEAKKVGLDVYLKEDTEDGVWLVKKPEEGVQTVNTDELINIIKNVDLDNKLAPAKKTDALKQGAKNVAKNVNKAARGLIPMQNYSQEILTKMSDEQLVVIAKKWVLPTEGVGRNQLIDGILKRQPPITEFQGGIFAFKPGIKSSHLRQLHKMFSQGWAQVVLQSDGLIEPSTENFRVFVEEHAGPLMSPGIKEAFYDWANTYNPKTNRLRQLVSGVTDYIKGFQSNPKVAAALNVDQKNIDAIMQTVSENMNEGISQKFSEGSDVGIDNYTHLNSAFFHSMGVTLDKGTIKKIEEQARLIDNFEDWVTEISKDEYGLIGIDGMTPVDIIANNLPRADELLQYYVSNLPENNIRINQGDYVVDPITGELETSQEKRVNLKVQKDRNGFKNLGIKKQANLEAEVGTGVKIRKAAILPTLDRPTMADRLFSHPLYWLHGSDVKSWQPRKDINGYYVYGTDGKMEGRFKPVYGFVDGDDMARLTKNILAPKNYVPLFIRGDSDKLGIIKITKAHKISAINTMAEVGLMRQGHTTGGDYSTIQNFDTYWEFEQAMHNMDDETVNLYKGLVKKEDGTWEKLTDEELTKQLGSPLKWRAANIARHEAFVVMLGGDYHKLSAHQIMHRIKILFTPTITRSGGRPSSMLLVDLEKLKDAVSKGKASPLTTKTHYPGGKTVEKELVLQMATGSDYVGDGQLITSQMTFDEKYSDEVGAKRGAKRAKIVLAYREGDKNLLLGKLQAMTYGLPSDAERAEIFNGNKKVAEIIRDARGENIYVDNGSGVFDRYVDHFGTTDEIKIQLGTDMRKFEEVIELPSEATGHIQFTKADKERAPFPMQIANYMDDPGFINSLNRLIQDNNNPSSAANVLDYMYRIALDSKKFDKFILDMRNRHPDSVPRTIQEAAKLGAGHHPTQLDYGKSLVKNKLFSEAMDLKQLGGVLDFRANFTDTVDKDSAVLPYDHEIRRTIAGVLNPGDPTKVMNMSLSEVNQALKDSPVYIQLTRHPVPSKSGYRIYKVGRFETGIGDSFLINDYHIKETFEGDHDHDTGHVMVLPPDMLEVMKRNQKDLGGLNLKKYAEGVTSPNIGSLSESARLMGDMSAGQKAIGEIANVQRVAGISQLIFNSMEIEGKTVRVRKFDSEVINPDTGEKQSLELYLRLQLQAAVDNVSFRLLSHWDYSQEKLYKMVFYNTDGSPISDLQYAVLNHGYIKTLKKTQAIKHGNSEGNSLSLTELLRMSQTYDEFVADREKMIRIRLNGLVIEGAWKGIGNDLTTNIDLTSDIHPHEMLAVLPARRIPKDSEGKPLSIEEIFGTSRLRSATAHDIAFREISDRQERLDRIITAYAMDKGDPTITYEQLNEQEMNEILRGIKSGEQWGSQMRRVMNSVYESFENDPDRNLENREANSQTWDYNSDFVQFAEDWINGTELNRGYVNLSEVEKIAGTYQFLGGIWDSKNKNMQYNARKLPPHMQDEGIFQDQTLLHPGLMIPFYKKYNEIHDDRNFDFEGHTMAPQERLNKTIKGYFGCE